MRVATSLGGEPGQRGALLSGRPRTFHPGPARRQADLRRLRHHATLSVARRVLPHRAVARRANATVVAGARLRGASLRRLRGDAAGQALRARRRGARSRSSRPGSARRVRRRRPVAAVQGHRLAIQVAVQAAAGGGLRQPVPAAALPGAGFQAGHLSWSRRPGRARSVYRRLSRHRTLPVRARCSGAAGARPTLPVPEDQPTAESSTGQPQQELATQPARTPDPRLALGRAAVRSARQSQPVEGAPGQSGTPRAGQRTDLWLSLPQRFHPARASDQPAHQSRSRRTRPPPVRGHRTQGWQGGGGQPRHLAGHVRGQPDAGARL